MYIRGMFAIDLFFIILYSLLTAYFFLASIFFGGQSFIKMITDLPLLYSLPILLVIITFGLTQYQIWFDSKQGLEMASSKGLIFFVLNLVFIMFSSYKFLTG